MICCSIQQRTLLVQEFVVVPSVLLLSRNWTVVWVQDAQLPRTSTSPNTEVLWIIDDLFQLTKPMNFMVAAERGKCLEKSLCLLRTFEHIQIGHFWWEALRISQSKRPVWLAGKIIFFHPAQAAQVDPRHLHHVRKHLAIVHWFKMSTYPSLGGVRGICSILIVSGHFFTFFAPTNPNKYPTATIDYLPPVSIFFIMSGFLLGVIYQDKLDDWNQRKDFWIKRFARIAPMYYFSLLISIPVVIAYTNTFGLLTSLILSPLFLQSLTLVGNDWNGPLWQCSALALCYLIYPFFLKFIRNRNPWIWGTVFYLFSLVLLCMRNR